LKLIPKLRLYVPWLPFVIVPDIDTNFWAGIVLKYILKYVSFLIPWYYVSIRQSVLYNIELYALHIVEVTAGLQLK